MLGPHTITRQRAAVVTDTYGNKVPDWTIATAVTVEGCSFQPGSGSRLNDNRAAFTILASVWAPSSADVVETDRIEFSGVVYDIDSIERWAFPPLDHLVIHLKEVSG